MTFFYKYRSLLELCLRRPTNPASIIHRSHCQFTKGVGVVNLCTPTNMLSPLSNNSSSECHGNNLIETPKPFRHHGNSISPPGSNYLANLPNPHSLRQHHGKLHSHVATVPWNVFMSAPEEPMTVIKTTLPPAALHLYHPHDDVRHMRTKERHQKLRFIHRNLTRELPNIFYECVFSSPLEGFF